VRFRGLLAWLAVCAAYAALDLSGLLDGLLVPVPLMLALVFARAVRPDSGWEHASRLVAAVVAAACLPAAAMVWRFGVGLGALSPFLLVVALLAFGATLALLLVPPIGARVLHALGLHPSSAVHRVVALAFLLTVIDAAALFLELAESGPVQMPFYPSDPVVSLMSDLALALAGVGFGLTRDFRATLARLDLRRMTRRQLVGAVAVALVFQLIIGMMEHLESVLLPSIHALEDRFGYDFVGLPPWVGAVLTSVGAGVGEEVLFRGALQPRLGVVLTAVLFGALHVQYQVPGMIMIVLMGIALGVLKNRTSTTFTALVHVLYDVGAFLLPDF
jgi:membrane protease YdiL (CAAX protease family)